VKTNQGNWLKNLAILKLLGIAKLENHTFFPWKKYSTRDDSHKPPILKKVKTEAIFTHGLKEPKLTFL
jgi:hypothetical protein